MYDNYMEMEDKRITSCEIFKRQTRDHLHRFPLLLSSHVNSSSTPRLGAVLQ